MANMVEISPEVVRLAQTRASQAGLPLSYEIARAIAEESVLSLDPELNLVPGTAEAVSDIDTFAVAAGANDIVVNDKHIDVRVLQNGQVHISRALVGTPYLASGSLVVALDSNHSGRVVGYVGPGSWLAAEEQFYKEQDVHMELEIKPNFDLSSTLTDVCSRVMVTVPVPQRSLPDEKELAKFIHNKEQVIVPRQKQIVSAVLTHSQTRELFAAMDNGRGRLNQILTDAARWNARAQQIADKVAGRFANLSRNDVLAIVQKIGETYGGQPEAPEFRRALLGSLAKEQLARKLQGVPVAKALSVLEQAFSGRPAVDSVLDFVRNKVAVDLATTIKRNRHKVEKFAAATAEELGCAVQQLALQPVYATHSADSGLDAINEALVLLDAGELGEELRDLDQELANS